MLCTPNAWALTWWVDDAQDAEVLEETLGAFWADGDVQVVVGEPQGADGIWVQDGVLVFTDDGRRLQQQVAGDPTTQVLLARSWALSLESSDAGWTPAPPPLVRPEPPPPPMRTGWAWGLETGPGLRTPFHGPPLHAAAELRWLRGPNSVAGYAVFDVGETLRYLDAEGGASGARWGVGVLGGRERPFASGTAELQLGLAVRQQRTWSGAALTGSDTRGSVLRPAAVARLRWWGPATGPNRLGVALLATVDGTPRAWSESVQHTYPDGTQPQVGPELPWVRFSPLTLHLEFCYGRRIGARDVPS